MIIARFHWSPGDDARLFAAASATARPTWKAIAANLGCTPDQARARWATLDTTLNRIPCHCCRTPFRPDGRFNRLCKTCKSNADDMSPLDSGFGFSTPGVRVGAPA